MTAVVYLRRPLLVGEHAQVIAESLQWLREHQRIRLHAFVVMPDHVHALLEPVGAHALPEIVRSLKGFSGHVISRRLGVEGRFWQDGYYDRRMRDVEELERVARYLVEIPVRKGLALRPEDFEHGSAHPDWGARIDIVEVEEIQG